MDLSSVGRKAVLIKLLAFVPHASFSADGKDGTDYFLVHVDQNATKAQCYLKHIHTILYKLQSLTQSPSSKPINSYPYSNQIGGKWLTQIQDFSVILFLDMHPKQNTVHFPCSNVIYNFKNGVQKYIS